MPETTIFYPLPNGNINANIKLVNDLGSGRIWCSYVPLCIEPINAASISTNTIRRKSSHSMEPTLDIDIKIYLGHFK